MAGHLTAMLTGSKKCGITKRATSYAKFYRRSHNAVIRVYDEAGNLIEAHEHAGAFKEW
jgi:hypothetical protein